MKMQVFLLIACLFIAGRALQVPKNVAKLAPRVVLSPLPTVYVYDHCPFCVRVRLALGLKNIKHNIVFFANDDVFTPTSLVGKKIAPIFSFADDIKPMPESLDIIAKIDSDSRFGATGLFKPMSNRPDLAAWQKKAKEVNSLAQRPRYMMSPLLAEFSTQDGRDAFVKNHPIPPYEKPEWKEKLSGEERWMAYAKSYDASLLAISEINKNLQELDKLIFSEEHCTEGGISLDDIDLWSRLRSLTLVKGVEWPRKLSAYLHNLSAKGDVPLMFSMAC